MVWCTKCINKDAHSALVRTNNKENIKSLITGHSVRGIPRLPAQRASNAESISMLCRFHDVQFI